MSTKQAGNAVHLHGVAAVPISSTTRSRLATLTLASMGGVYGDIATSPLHTLKTIFSRKHGLQLDHANLLGVIFLIF